MNRAKVVVLGSLAVLAFLLALGCSLLPRGDDGTGDGGHIRLRIQAPGASKGITVTDVDVTGLSIQVLDPDGELLQTIDWAASQGSKDYDVPVTQLGVYQLEVTHIGLLDGEEVRATESAAFSIRAMVITVIDIVPGGIGLVWIPVEGPGDWPVYGTWANEKYNGGLEGPAAKIIIRDNGVVELYRSVGDSDPFQTASFEIKNEWPDGQVRWFQTVLGQVLFSTVRISDGGSILEILSGTEDYPDPGEFGPVGENDPIYYRQE